MEFSRSYTFTHAEVPDGRAGTGGCRVALQAYAYIVLPFETPELLQRISTVAFGTRSWNATHNCSASGFREARPQ